MELQYLVTESKHAAISAMCTQYNYLSNTHITDGYIFTLKNTVEPLYQEHQYLEHDSYFEVHRKSQPQFNLFNWNPWIS